MKSSRRRFLKTATLSPALWPVLGNTLDPSDPQSIRHEPPPMTIPSRVSGDQNMLGGYGEWAASLWTDRPGKLSFRKEEWTDLETWRTATHERFAELLAMPEIRRLPGVSTIEETVFDGCRIEELSWQLPYGPPTRATLLKPEGAIGPLPGVLAMHDHGGNKYFGRRKLIRTAETIHPMIEQHQEQYYGGRAWANELARSGFAVLVPDAYAFGSRRVLLEDVPDTIRQNTTDVGPEERQEEIVVYNRWAAAHEHIMSKSLFCAGTTWPGVVLAEDLVALEVLASRADVDRESLGCCGLSGGGLRTVMLSGFDPRIKAAVCAGMMSTWRDYMLNTSHTHTWMIYIPLLPQYMDYSEIFGLQAPLPRLVLNNREDQLFTLPEMQRADRILQSHYEKAGARDRYSCEFYPGPHKFDEPMQNSAFSWLRRWLIA